MNNNKTKQQSQTCPPSTQTNQPQPTPNTQATRQQTTTAEQRTITYPNQDNKTNKMKIQTFSKLIYPFFKKDTSHDIIGKQVIRIK